MADTILNIEFTEYLEKIINALGIPSNQVEGEENLQDSIKNEMKKLNTEAKLQIINNTVLAEQVNKLLEADDKLHSLIKEGGELHTFYGRNQKEWNNTMSEVARLQGLIVLRKISETDCDGIIKTLLGAFDTKLKAVNDLLSADLKHKDQTGGDDMFKVKYEKYKMKYLTLKNKLH